MKAKYTYRGKRQLDFTLSIIALVILSPLMLIIAWAIFISSGRPIIFRMEVVGLAAKPIIIYKFRTMLIGAENLEELVYQQNGYIRPQSDPRITHFGKLLRKTGLDELPQLINILKGEMSLIGPRPSPTWRYNLILPEHRKLRLSLLPGLSGPAQIDLRNEELVKKYRYKTMEKNYANNCSLTLDLKIIIKSIKLIFFPNGAC